MRLTIAFLFVATWTAGGCGYDHASACARPQRAGRSVAPAVPCDLSKQSYCTTPGSSYPWHAIRRFVRENQGLMRRMYGEERHIAVLKAELENFIEDDEEEEDGNTKMTDFAEDIIKTKLMYSKKIHGRAMKDKPHFRPIQSGTDKNKKIENDTLKVKPLEISNNTKINSTSNRNKTDITNNETITDDKGISYKTKLESIANIEINNLDPDVITLEAVIKQSIETNSIYPNFQGTSKSEPLTYEKNNTERNTTTTTENILNSTETTDDQYVDSTTESSKDIWKAADTSTLPPTLLFSEHEKIMNDRIDTKVTDKKEEFHPKPIQHQESMRPSVIKLRGANACESKEEMAAPFWANSTRGEVLALLNMYPFEQYIHLETCVHEKKQMYCREGCSGNRVCNSLNWRLPPTNSYTQLRTRLRPRDAQYIRHTYTEANISVLRGSKVSVAQLRNGCEQQYRLHRLLAYDPRNECRGIFADWFKFPACCVCKCYDVPLEFRARSPRILHPQYEEDVKRVIYEDVARDWYDSAYDEEGLY